MVSKNQVASNLEDLEQDVIKSCVRANRNIKNVNIVAVSKTISKYPIIDAIKYGQQVNKNISKDHYYW